MKITYCKVIAIPLLAITMLACTSEKTDAQKAAEDLKEKLSDPNYEVEGLEVDEDELIENLSGSDYVVVEDEEMIESVKEILEQRNASANDTVLANEGKIQLDEESLTETPIVGSWNLLETYFINDGVPAEGSAPLVPTTWTFKSNGSVQIKSGMDINGTFSIEDKVITMNVFGGEQVYKILEFSGNKMMIQSSITPEMLTNIKFERK